MAVNSVLEAKLDQASILKRVIEALKDLLSDGSWDCTKTGMSLQSMDSSHVALVHVLLKSEGFETYRCTRNVSLGVSLASMLKVLKCAGNEDSITIRHDSGTSVVTFALHNAKDDRRAEFDLKLMALESEHLEVKETDYDCIVKMPSADFRKICQDLTQFGDSVTISCSKSDVVFETAGDIGKGLIRLNEKMDTKTPDREVFIKMEQPVSLTFALKYLSTFTKATALSDVVRLCMANNSPLCVEYGMPEVGYIRYYLAPKIEEEND